MFIYAADVGEGYLVPARLGTGEWYLESRDKIQMVCLSGATKLIVVST